jgi:hypothetical protein
MAVVTEPDTSGHLETGVMTWIRLSTGQLCIEVTDGNERDHTELNWSPPDPSPSLAINLMSGTGPTLDQNLMSTMTLNGIHLILCYLVFHRRLAVFQNLGHALFFWVRFPGQNLATRVSIHLSKMHYRII